MILNENEEQDLMKAIKRMHEAHSKVKSSHYRRQMIEFSAAMLEVFKIHEHAEQRKRK